LDINPLAESGSLGNNGPIIGVERKLGIEPKIKDDMKIIAIINTTPTRTFLITFIAVITTIAKIIRPIIISTTILYYLMLKEK
jgi:hypothetical protein